MRNSSEAHLFNCLRLRLGCQYCKRVKAESTLDAKHSENTHLRLHHDHENAPPNGSAAERGRQSRFKGWNVVREFFEGAKSATETLGSHQGCCWRGTCSGEDSPTHLIDKRAPAGRQFPTQEMYSSGCLRTTSDDLVRVDRDPLPLFHSDCCLESSKTVTVREGIRVRPVAVHRQLQVIQSRLLHAILW